MENKYFKVTCQAIYQRTVNIEADTEAKAIEKAQTTWGNCAMKDNEKLIGLEYYEAEEIK